MGKKGKWLGAVKKVFSPESKEKKEEVIINLWRWLLLRVLLSTNLFMEFLCWIYLDFTVSCCELAVGLIRIWLFPP